MLVQYGMGTETTRFKNIPLSNLHYLREVNDSTTDTLLECFTVMFQPIVAAHRFATVVTTNVIYAVNVLVLSRSCLYLINKCHFVLK